MVSRYLKSHTFVSCCLLPSTAPGPTHPGPSGLCHHVFSAVTILYGIMTVGIRGSIGIRIRIVIVCYYWYVVNASINHTATTVTAATTTVILIAIIIINAMIMFIIYNYI